MSEIFAHTGPVLLCAYALSLLALRAGLPGRPWTLAGVAAASMLICLVPVRGLSLSMLLLSFVPVFSVGSIALFSALIFERWSGKTLFDNRDMALLLMFNILYSLVLFMSSLGLLPLDLYAPGYGFTWLAATHFMVTACLILAGSPLAWVFLVQAGAWSAGLLPSPNLNDYITDVPLFVISASMLGARAAELRKAADV